MYVPSKVIKNEITTNHLFCSEVEASNLSSDAEYIFDAIVSSYSEDDEFTAEITRCAVQIGLYDDGETVMMSAWALVDMKKMSRKTLKALEDAALQAFWDNENNIEFPILPALVVSEYAPIISH